MKTTNQTADKSKPGKCPHCGGSGTVKASSGKPATKCLHCRGTGRGSVGYLTK